MDRMIVQMPGWFWILSVAVFGACIGSFLNVVIHRLPRGMRVDRPKGSVCPHCGQEIPWFRNLPVLSWCVQGGKAACCGKRIATRYVLVELLTACLFVYAWTEFGWPLGLVLCVWLALLVVGSFVDFEHMLLPDVVTIGGFVLGLGASFWMPQLHANVMGEVLTHGQGLLRSLVGVGVSLGLMLTVWQLGKWAFGRIRIVLDEPEEFVVQERGERVEFSLAEERMDWGEIFARGSDRLRVWVDSGELDGARVGAGMLQFQRDAVEFVAEGEEKEQAEPRRWDLEGLQRVRGWARKVVVPREAMGFGDVLLLGMLGAWCGWQGALFALGAGAMLGLLVALPVRLLGLDKSENFRMPFGPFLSAGAVLFVFEGRLWVEQYLVLLGAGGY